ncbi:MAG: TIGR02757 family protein [Treponema sp.]|jgi:uncharacterized protein (TIGR02757 family)|nr:TIGR02757 family protein [Treponema sp.]
MDLKKELDAWYTKINRPEFVLTDPVQFPRRYMDAEDKRRQEHCRRDVEIAAFLTAVIAWGRRDNILRSAERLFARMGPSPAAFVMSGNRRELKDRCIHRTFFEADLQYFRRGFRTCYKKYGSLESLFSLALEPPGGTIWDGIALFRETMAEGNGGRCNKHIANPAAHSACKRINLALRWLVRKEGPVDLGLWKSVPPAALLIPLDLHVGRTARRLGLLERKANDRKAVEELTAKLRDFCPEDPVKYDFALFGMGTAGAV